jgi:hypothetical protein
MVGWLYAGRVFRMHLSLLAGKSVSIRSSIITRKEVRNAICYLWVIRAQHLLWCLFFKDRPLLWVITDRRESQSASHRVEVGV